MNKGEMLKRVDPYTYRKLSDKTKTPKGRIPVILQVTPRWTAPDGMQVFLRMDSVVMGDADAETFEGLVHNKEVISAQTDRSGGRLG